MSENLFDHIAEGILKQKALMDELEAENRELRQQLTDLRSGRGIFVDLPSIRFALRDDSSPVQTNSVSSVPVSDAPLTSTNATSTLSAPNQAITEVPTAEIAEITPQSQEKSASEQVSSSSDDGGKKSTSEESTFLEEILIDEFASALTSPKAVWQDPTEKQPSSKPQSNQKESINEKQKEALRRELMGSFLLE